jgi:hypothetical protein
LNFFHRRDKRLKAEKAAAKIAEKEAKKAEKLNPKKRSVSTQDKSTENKKTARRKVDESGEVEVEDVNEKEEYFDEDIPVFDDCDDVRIKIARCIQSEGMNQTKFSRVIGITSGKSSVVKYCFHDSCVRCGVICAASVTRFLSRKGSDQGAGSEVYARSYRYFEKLRLQNQEPKSAKRIRNEAQHPMGFPLVNAQTQYWVCLSK